MSDGWQTDTVTLTLTRDVFNMLQAFNAARNGSISNSANVAIRAGIENVIASNPQWAGFRERYNELLALIAQEPTNV